VRRLLAAGADATEPDGRGMTPLLHAASRGHGDVVGLLVKQPGVKVDAQSPDGYTAMLLAAFGGHASVVKALLAGGANPNWKPPPARRRPLAPAGPSGAGPSSEASPLEGWTPLLVACQQGSAAVVAALLGAGAQAHASLPEDNTTALMLAAQGGVPEVVKALLSAGAKVNAVDIDGANALHCAVLRARQKSDTDCVRLLLSAGADPLACASSGETPLSMAAELPPGPVTDDVCRALGAAAAAKGGKSSGVGDNFSDSGSGASSRSDGRPPGSPRKRFQPPQNIPQLEL